MVLGATEKMKDIRVELLSEKRLFDIATNGRNIMEHF